MSILTELKDKISEGATNAKGWIEELEGKAPELAALATKYESSPIVQALEGAILPPEVEASIAAIIKHFASEVPAPAATVPTTTAPVASA